MRWRLLTCLLSACLFPDLSGLDGRAADGGATDAPVTSDGGTITKFCASQSPAPSFCDDFDDGAPLLANDGGAFPPWGYGTATYNSTLTLDSTKFRSPPYSMLSQTFPQSSAYVYPAAYVTKFIPSGVSLVTLGMDVYVDRIDPAPDGTRVLTFVVSDASLQLVVQQGGTAYVIDGYDAPDGAAQSPQLGQSMTLIMHQWMHLVLTVDFNTNTVAVTMDPGTGPVQVLPTTHSINTFTASSPAAFFGVYYSHATTTGAAVYYDDITIDWK